MKPPLFPVHEDTLVFAFRYALGRRTAAPSLVVAELKRQWPQITERTRQQIQRDIEDAIERGEAGDSCDLETWREVLALPSDCS